MLRVAVVDAIGRPLRAAGLARWLSDLAPSRVTGTVSIALVSDARVRHLNRTYRSKDVVTDVLSFPFEPTPDNPHLGDIVIAIGQAARQARGAGHALRTELRILSLHGLLHLIGYDHETDTGAMERRERRLRRQGGLMEGLIERAGGPRGTKRTRPGEGPRSSVSGVERAGGPRGTKRTRPGEGPRSSR